MKIVHSLILCALACPNAPAGELTKELADRYRREGAAAQAQGRLLAARNGWYKYLATRELEPGFAESGEDDRIRTWIVSLSRVPEAPKREDDRPPVAPKEKNVEKPVRLSSKELMKKAELLYKSGQLDEALRLYRLAASAAPASSEIQEKIRQIEIEMN